MILIQCKWHVKIKIFFSLFNYALIVPSSSITVLPCSIGITTTTTTTTTASATTIITSFTEANNDPTSTVIIDTITTTATTTTAIGTSLITKMPSTTVGPSTTGVLNNSADATGKFLKHYCKAIII